MIKKVNAAKIVFSIIVMLGLTGCTRTINDIEKWKRTNNQTKLIKALEDPKAEIRCAAADALGELKSVPAVDPLTLLFSDTDSAARQRSVEALVQIADPKVIDSLISALELKDAQIRLIAAKGLGLLNATKAASALIAALNDEEEGVRCAAATSLGQVGDETASAPLVAKLSDGSDEMRLIVVKALAHTKGDAGINGLADALADPKSTVRSAAVESLITIGAPAIEDAMHEALKSSLSAVRRSAVDILRDVKAIPATGVAAIWYTLAKVSIDTETKLDMSVVSRLAQLGDSAVYTLLEAVAHSNADIRDHASRTLEEIGDISTAKAVAAVEANANTSAKEWFKERNKWAGSPAWQLDLWGAIAALNPDFKPEERFTNNMEMKARPAFLIISSPDFQLNRENIPYLINLLGDDTVPPPEQADVDEHGMPIVKKQIDKFRGVTNQLRAQECLVEMGSKAVFPLLAALDGDSTLIQDNAATVLSRIGDRRAIEPLMKAVEACLNKGENLADSPLYIALLQFNAPEAEPLVLRIRPHTDRVIQVIERKYPAIDVKVCETRDFSGEAINNSIKFYLGYSDGKNSIQEATVLFSKNAEGHWEPQPDLPAEITDLSN